MRRLYVGHYSTTLRIPATKTVYSHTDFTFTDFREPCSHHPDNHVDNRTSTDYIDYLSYKAKLYNPYNHVDKKTQQIPLIPCPAKQNSV